MKHPFWVTWLSARVIGKDWTAEPLLPGIGGVILPVKRRRPILLLQVEHLRPPVLQWAVSKEVHQRFQIGDDCWVPMTTDGERFWPCRGPAPPPMTMTAGGGSRAL